MPGYSFFKSEGENYGNVKSIYTRDIRYKKCRKKILWFYNSRISVIDKRQGDFYK